MKKILLFDLDGTIAESRKQIDDETLNYLLLSRRAGFALGLVIGGRKERVDVQLRGLTFDHVFSECGSVYHKWEKTRYQEIYRNNIRKHLLYSKINILIKCALSFLSSVDYHITGSFIDLRDGLVFISLIGMQSNLEERKKFLEIDGENDFRGKLLEILRQKATEMEILDSLDILEGGQTGIYIYPKEWNKKQVIDYLNDYEEILYFGDKYKTCENDYEILHHPRVKGYPVNSIEDTKNLLKEIIKNSKNQ